MTSYVLSKNFFETQDGGHVLCTVSKFHAFLSRFALENISNRSKTVLVILIALTLEGIRGGGQSDPPSIFFGLKFLFLDRLPKALAQMFFFFVKTSFDSN